MTTVTAIKGRKGGSSKQRTPTEQPDDLQSIAKAKLLIALGEGEFAGGLDGKSIFLDGTPLENADGSQNFSGVAWEFRSGTQAQKYIQGMPGTENEISVGTVVKSAVAWTHTFTNTQLSAIRLRLKWPSLFNQEDDGDLVGYSIKYAIDLQTDGGTWTTVIDTAVTGKTTSGYERSHRIDLPQAGSTWTVRLRKITADANSAKIGDTMTLQSYTEVIDAKLRYPNTALLYIEFDSSQFNGSIPPISCEPKMRVIRVPDNYDPVTRSYSGTWTGSFKWAWTDNPAWIFYDIVVTDRFGLGNRLTAENIDKWTLYQVAQYCDQMVPDGKGGSGTEPRYTCNVYIQSRNDAYTVLRDFAAIFRGMTYYGGNQIVALADMPRDIDYSYTRANVIDGIFNYSSSTTKNRYTTALVSWSDPDNAYADAMESVFEQELVTRYGFNQLEITAIGCTRQSEANRKGRWGILTNNKDRVVTFSVGLDGMIPQPGYVIAVADELLSGKVTGGRISAVNGRVITLDRKPDAVAGDRLILNLPSGAAQSRTIQAVNGNAVTVTVAYGETPQAESVWVVESDELYAQQYRVLSVADNNDGTFTISGAYYDPDKYARIDTGALIDERPVSVIPPGNQFPPDSIVISSFSVVQQGISVETMRVQWDSVQNAISYEAQWRRNDGNWISVARSSTTSFEVPGIYTGRYLVRVRAINAAEISSGWSYSDEKTLTGKVGNPPKPVGFTASDNVVFGIELNWGFPANTGDTLKTEIQYSKTAAGDEPVLLADVPYPSRKYQQMGLKAGITLWYRAQLVDKTGNESGYTEWVMGQSSTDVSDITDAILEEIKGTDIFNDLIENAIETSQTVAGLAKAIRDNADSLADAVQASKEITDGLTVDVGKLADDILSNSEKLAEAVQSSKDITDGIIVDVKKLADDILNNSDSIAAATAANKQTAEAVISNAMTITDVVVRQTAQNGANSAKFEQLREVITTETEARVTDVTRLEAKSAQNESGLTEVRQSLATETEARTTAVDELTAQTEQNEADITSLSQTVTTLDSSTSSRFDELTAKTDRATGAIQNTAIASITNTLAQADIRTTMEVQNGANSAKFENVSQAISTETEARVSDVTRLEAKVGENADGTAKNAADITGVRQAIVTETEARVSDVTRLEAKAEQNAASITEVRQALTTEEEARATAVDEITVQVQENEASITEVREALVTETEARTTAVDELTAQTEQNEAGITSLSQTVTTLDSSTSSRFDELTAKTDRATGAIQNTAIASITNTLAQADLRTTMEVQNGANLAKFENVSQAIATETEARVSDVTRLEAKAKQNDASITSLASAFADESSATVSKLDELTTTTEENTAGISAVMQAVTDEEQARVSAVNGLKSETQVISDKADGAAEKAAGAAEEASRNTAEISTLNQTVTDQASSTASRFDEISAQIEGQEGQTGEIKGSVKNTAVALIQGTLAQVNARQTLSAVNAANSAQIDRIDTVAADDRKATAESLQQMSVKVDENTASINSISSTVSDFRQSTATQVDSLTATINDVSAAVVMNAQATADIEGNLNAMYSIKVGVDENGVRYAAGMGIGVENTPDGMQSQVLFLADRFAVMSQAGGEVSSPFVIQNGQTFIRETFIQDGTITNAKIGSFIQSTNYVANTSGWQLNKSGTFYINGSAGTGRMVISNTLIQIFDNNNVLRVRMGLW